MTIEEEAISWLGKCDVTRDDSCFQHLQFVNLVEICRSPWWIPSHCFLRNENRERIDRGRMY